MSNEQTGERALEEAHRLKYRPDIDGLRAIAVLAVVAYHYFPKWFPGGFIGVDVFFVISGYLITGILGNALDSGNLSLAYFYERRIRRIFPALILILSACLVVGWFVLLPDEFARLGKHIAAGAAYVENFVLLCESGYFDAAATHKPLLHLWSLAVEEQFYIFWPLLLLAAARKRWSPLAMAMCVAVLSFAINVWIAQRHPEADFYLPITRAWELMIGAAVAIGQSRNATYFEDGYEWQAWLGAALLVIGFAVIRWFLPFPGYWALLPVAGSALLIQAGPEAWLNRACLSWRPATWLGLASYPLYMWHWVLLSLVIVIFAGFQQRWITTFKLAALVASFALAALTYRFVERPLRRCSPRKASLLLVTGVAACGLAGLGVFISGGRIARYSTPTVMRYLASVTVSPMSRQCMDLSDGRMLAKDWYCELGDRHATTWIMVYGDSHARSMIPALDRYGQRTHVRVVFAAYSACLPLLGVSVDAATGQACAELARAAVAYAATHHPELVVFVQRWTYYVGLQSKPHGPRQIQSNLGSPDPGEKTLTGIAALRRGLELTMARYQSLGIPVLLMEDNPRQLGDIPLGVLRFTTSVRALNSNSVTLTEHREEQAATNALLVSMERRFSNVHVLNTDGALCGPKICPWVNGGKFLYFDPDHLSISGAMRVYPLLTAQLDCLLRRARPIPKGKM